MTKPADRFDALKLSALRDALMSRAGSKDRHGLSIDFIVEMNEVARLGPESQLYEDPYLVLQLSNGVQGYVFAHPGEFETPVHRDLVGRSIPTIDITSLPNYLTAALIDALAGVVLPRREPNYSRTLRGTAAQKSGRRAEIIKRLTADPRKAERIAVIGAIEDIIHQLVLNANDVRIADYHLAGTTMANIRIEPDYNELLLWCDRVLVTGNVLKTDTLAAISRNIAKRRIHACMYCMTGHNLLPRIMSDLPFAHIVAEEFPFYWYANPTRLKIYSSEYATLNPNVW